MTNLIQREFLEQPLTESLALDGFNEILTKGASSVSKNDGHLLLWFSVCQNLLALPVHAIEAVTSPRSLARIPFIRNPLCLGFLPYQGNAVPMLDIAAWLALTPSSSVYNHANQGRILILRHDSLLTAIQVDQTLGLQRWTGGGARGSTIRTEWGVGIGVDVSQLTYAAAEGRHG